MTESVVSREGRLRKFVVGVVKLALALALAILVVIGVVAGVTASRDSTLGKAKEWPPILVEALDSARFHLRTAWKDGRMLYQFDVAVDSSVIRSALRTGTDAAFTIEFSDKDGFALLQHPIRGSDFSRIIDTVGRTTAISWKGDEYASADVYRQLSKWNVSWTGAVARRGVDAPAPLARSSGAPDTLSEPKWKNLQAWRQLHRGMSGDSVKLLLGEPDKIEQYSSFSNWHFGYPSGGRVTIENGRLDSWAEPSP